MHNDVPELVPVTEESTTFHSRNLVFLFVFREAVKFWS